MQSVQQTPEKGQQVPPPKVIDGVSEQQIDEAVKTYIKAKRQQQAGLAFTEDAKGDSSFRFDQTDIRVVMIKDEPWFVATDVCEALQIANSRDALLKLDADEKGVGLTDTLGGPQKLGVVSESGMYTLVLRCRDAVKPGTVSHRFRKWVTSEVLPSIRKNGGYATEQRMRLAQTLATEATSGVARAVFDAVMAGGNVELDSWLLSFGTNYDKSPRPYATLMPRGTFHVTAERLVEWIAEGEQGAAFTNEQLAALAEACAGRLKRRIEWDQAHKAKQANKAGVA